MFLRLLTESFRRQKRRKALAAAAILLGTTAVTAMLALATTIGDRIHQELAVYGANIIVTPRADTLDVNIGGLNFKPATGNTYLHESDLNKLQTIFWHNNITAISPEHEYRFQLYKPSAQSDARTVSPSIQADAVAYWFGHPFGSLSTGAPSLHPWWKLEGRWPERVDPNRLKHAEDGAEVVLGAKLAKQLGLGIGDWFRFNGLNGGYAPEGDIVGVVSAGDKTDDQMLMRLDPELAPNGAIQEADISRIEIAARTRPEDAFARRDPDSLSPKQRDLWYCRPYANSIAYQIQEAIPNSTAQQVRKVEQSEGTVLSRISGLMWLISAAALLAAGFAVSAAMATAVLERRTEIGLMRSLGSSRATVAALFYSESALLALVAGSLGFVAGSALAWLLGRSIFPGEPTALFNPVLLPAILTLAILVAIAGSTPAIRAALNANPSQTLRSTD